jgi:Putative Flp pilus-assembly TadE/G-like
MNGQSARGTRPVRGQRGQIIVIAALSLIAFIGGVSLIIEGGNAYAHQRVAQNATDAVANAGATVLAQRLGGGTEGDAEVAASMANMATANELDTYSAWYTDVTGELLNAGGAVVGSTAGAAEVGDGTIPPGAQGVRAGGSQAFGTTFARVLGVTQFTASADATSVTGALTGGEFLPVVFPVSMANCDGSGDTIVTDEKWRMSDPNPDPNLPPVGQEYIVPLCKTTEGAFQVLDLDPDKTCAEEVTNPTRIQFQQFPVDVQLDTGNDCAKKIEGALPIAGKQGTIVMIPICDGACHTMSSGNDKFYHIIRIASFYLDYMSDSNNDNNSMCALATSPTYGTDLDNIVGGNGSSSCMAGWFVRYVTSGPVGTGQINNGEAIGVQLIR